jgi:hypothetical protein
MPCALNQDVRDVIAEYAVGTVADACALRAVSTEWRLAVDGRVRNLVAMSQAGLQPWSCDGERSTPLVLVTDNADARDTDLDDARRALLGEPVDAIVRLVVTAFALGGANDPVHEQGWCGPRPVETRGRPPSVNARGSAWLFHHRADDGHRTFAKWHPRALVYANLRGPIVLDGSWSHSSLDTWPRLQRLHLDVDVGWTPAHMRTIRSAIVTAAARLRSLCG